MVTTITCYTAEDQLKNSPALLRNNNQRNKADIYFKTRF